MFNNRLSDINKAIWFAVSASFCDLLPVARFMSSLNVTLRRNLLQYSGYTNMTVVNRLCSVAVQLLSHVELFVTPWTATHQTSLSFTISLSLLKLMSTEPTMPSSHLILCRPLLLLPLAFPASGSFPVSWLFTLGRQSIGVSASALVLPMNIQGWFPGLISLLS